jgi:hypothetical protein
MLIGRGGVLFRGRRDRKIGIARKAGSYSLLFRGRWDRTAGIARKAGSYSPRFVRFVGCRSPHCGRSRYPITNLSEPRGKRPNSRSAHHG